jgi:choline dehydrogenase-like flavoprotein
VLIKPRARGKVFLRSHLPDAKPRVLHNFLTEEEDRQSMIAGIRMAMDIARKAPLAELLSAPYRVPASDSDEDILAFIRREAMTVFHPTSSCAIGAVVDSELRVLGVEGLRVVDASVMPRITRGNTNAPTIMIAEKAADHIAGKRAAGTAAALA